MDNAEVLMVEDNPGDVVLIQEAMRKAGLPFRLQVARDGVAATELLWGVEGRPAIRPDLIILDLKLPRKNGRELLEEIQGDPSMRLIPVVLLSSSPSELELARSFRLPPKSYLVKPSTFSGYIALVQSLAAFLEESRGENAGCS